jgi:MinD-like ATPase involved in chromosome partitioning or flagellar assembly
MAGPLIVGVAATPQPWRREFEFFVADHVDALRLVPLHDAAEAFGDVDVMVIDDTLTFLTPVEVMALRDRGVRVVGVHDPSGRAGRGRGALERLGVDAVVSADAGPEALVEVVADLGPARLRRARSNGRAPAGRAPGPDTSEGSVVVAVGGGSDSPGRTEAAIAVAHWLARWGERVLLVDLDEHNPSVARRLGYHLTPNVLDALAAVATGADIGQAIGRRAAVGGGEVGFSVVPGLANPGDWAQLHDVANLLDAAARHWRYLVVDTGPVCGSDQVPPGGTRNAATRAALRRADHVVAVCNGTRSGVLRFLDWAADAAELVDAPVTVAINRAPRESFRRAELRDQMIGNLPDHLVGEVVCLPPDRLLGDADWHAALPASGPFTRAIESLVRRFGSPQAAPVRGLARLVAGRR